MQHSQAGTSGNYGTAMGSSATPTTATHHTAPTNAADVTAATAQTPLTSSSVPTAAACRTSVRIDDSDGDEKASDETIRCSRHTWTWPRADTPTTPSTSVAGKRDRWHLTRRSSIAVASALVVLFVLLVSFAAMYHYRNGGSGATTDASGCVTPFGAVLGAHDGVLAFSNCNDSYVSRQGYNVSVPVDDKRDGAGGGGGGGGDEHATTTKMTSLYSGMKWQCVEYARRYWMLRGQPAPATFGDVDGAEDIWTQLSEAQLLNGTRVPLRKHGNGVDLVHGGSAPRVGDLLIYTRDAVTMPYGHVAVVVGVDFAGARVYLAEQNWDSDVWPAPHHNYSRTVAMHYEAAASRYILDDAPYTVAGWVRYGAD